MRNSCNWNVTNDIKLVGLRFKLKEDMTFSFDQQYKYVLNKIGVNINRLKTSLSMNKYISPTESVNLYKSYCVSITD